MKDLKSFSILKIKKSFFIAVATLALSVTSKAEIAPDVYRVGLSGGYITYLEPGYVSFYGAMFGVDSIIQLNFSPLFDLRIEGDLLYGNIQYDGSVKNTTTNAISPLKAGAYDYILVGRVKPEFYVVKQGPLDLFINFGVGARYLNDRVNSNSGYQREVSYLFLPFGARANFHPKGAISYGFDLEYDLFVLGAVKSHLSDTNPTNPDVTNSQSSGYGIRFQTEIRLQSGQISYGIKPYFQWWNVGASDAAPYTTGLVLVEPQNSSSLAGVIFDIGF